MSLVLRSFVLALAALAVGAGCSPGEGSQASRSEASAAVRDAPDFGRVETVTVEAEGSGQSEREAVTSAIRNAIVQVNGQAVQGGEFSALLTSSNAEGGRSIDYSSSAFAELIHSQTRGAVTSFRLLRSNRSGELWRVRISADVARFVAPEDARPRVIVLPARTQATTFVVGDRTITGPALGKMVQGRLAERFLSSNRFTVLDREFSSEVLEELSIIGTGRTRNAEMARLGQANIADLLVVPEVVRFEYARHERRLRTSDRVLSSYSGDAELRVTIVNVATGSVEMRKTFVAAWPSTEPTTLGRTVDGQGMARSMLDQLSSDAANAFIQHHFPVAVIAWSGDRLTLSQGDGVVAAGERYRIVRLGKQFTDPQTGRSLGREEHAIGVIEITGVQQETASARLVDGAGLGPSVFTPGGVELREQVAVTREVAAATVSGRTAPSRKSQNASEAETQASSAQATASDDVNW